MLYSYHLPGKSKSRDSLSNSKNERFPIVVILFFCVYIYVTTKSTYTDDKHKDTVGDSVITINEKVSLTKQQHQDLKIICNTYELSISEYMLQALVEAIKFDIEEGNLCDTLLEKIDDDNKKGNNSPSPPSPNSMNSDLDMLKELQI